MTVSETGTLCLQHQIEALSVSTLEEVTVAFHKPPGSLVAGPLAIYVGPVNVPQNVDTNSHTVSHQTQTMDVSLFSLSNRLV